MSRVQGERAREGPEGGDQDGSGGRAKQICSMKEKESEEAGEKGGGKGEWGGGCRET